jgi:hypothetical protein
MKGKFLQQTEFSSLEYEGGHKVRFQVLTAASIKIVFWDNAPPTSP